MNLSCPKCGSFKTRLEGSRRASCADGSFGSPGVEKYPVTVADTWDFLCFMVQECEWAASDLAGRRKKKRRRDEEEDETPVDVEGNSRLVAFCRDCGHQIASAECKFEFNLPWDDSDYVSGFKQSRVPAMPAVEIPRAED